MKNTKRVTYHAIVGHGPFEEVLVVRQGEPGAMPIVSQEPTGVTYKTWNEAVKGIESKNKAA